MPGILLCCSPKSGFHRKGREEKLQQLGVACQKTLTPSSPGLSSLAENKNCHSKSHLHPVKIWGRDGNLYGWIDRYMRTHRRTVQGQRSSAAETKIHLRHKQEEKLSKPTLNKKPPGLGFFLLSFSPFHVRPQILISLKASPIYKH